MSEDAHPIVNAAFDRADRAAQAFWAAYQEARRTRRGVDIGITWEQLPDYERDMVRHAISAAFLADRASLSPERHRR